MLWNFSSSIFSVSEIFPASSKASAISENSVRVSMFNFAFLAFSIERGVLHEKMANMFSTVPFNSSRRACADLMELPPVEMASSTTKMFLLVSPRPSTIFPAPCPFGFDRTYNIGFSSFSATNDAQGMPAVAVPEIISFGKLFSFMSFKNPSFTVFRASGIPMSSRQSQ